MDTENTTGVTSINRAASVLHHLDPISFLLEDETVTEIAINRDKEVWCERDCKWEVYDSQHINYNFLMSLSTAVAKYSKDEIDDTKPILSALLPKGERVQIVIPPACEHSTISVTIRKPSFKIRTLADYESEGFFSNIRPISDGLLDHEEEMLKYQREKNYIKFIELAIKHGKSIVVAGETGSGKTTFMKALSQEIPTNQRIITIEDVPELFLPNHPNHVHLYYPSEASEEMNSPITASSLLKCSLRMKPSRILLAELRGGEAFDFVNVAASGHAGSITSCHAGSASLAFERLALMILQNRQGRTLQYDLIRKLLYMVVDVVVHVHNDIDGNHGRHISELWYDPMIKRKSLTTNI